jgi:hypothetical protein
MSQVREAAARESGPRLQPTRTTAPARQTAKAKRRSRISFPVRLAARRKGAAIERSGSRGRLGRGVRAQHRTTARATHQPACPTLARGRRLPDRGSKCATKHAPVTRGFCAAGRTLHDSRVSKPLDCATVETGGCRRAKPRSAGQRRLSRARDTGRPREVNVFQYARAKLDLDAMRGLIFLVQSQSR